MKFACINFVPLITWFFVALLCSDSQTLAQKLPFCGVGKLPPAGSVSAPPRLRAQATLPPANTLGTPTIIEVMFLYTPEALKGAGDKAALEEKVQNAIDEANYACTNSDVNISIRSVYVGEIGYPESGDIRKDLAALANLRGEFAAVAPLWNDYKADIICLVTEMENQGIGGLAWDIPPVTGDPTTPFLAVRRSELGRSKTLAHELGHLFGCAHDRDHINDPSSPFYLARRPYIFGHRLEVEGVTYIDVMAYEPGVTLPFFSNPQRNLDGVPLGVSEGGPNPSDTARTINETAPYVALYKQAFSRMEFETDRSEVLRSDGSVILRLRRTGDLSEATGVVVTVLPESTASPQLDYTLAPNTAVLFGANASEASLVVPLLEASGRGEKTLRLALSSPVGQHGIGLHGQTTIVLREMNPAVRLDSITVLENSGTATLQPVFLGTLMEEAPKLTWHLLPDAARSPADYIDTNGTLAIRRNADSYEIEPIRITLLDNQAAEADRLFHVVVSGTTHGGINLAPVTNDVRIVDDDRRGAVFESPGALLAPDGGFNVAVRHDKKFLIWGGFSTLGDTARTAIALLNSDGSIDEKFRPPEFLAGHKKIEHVDNATIGTVQLLPQGKLLVAGDFARANGQMRSTLARLNADGSLDETFGTDLKFDGAVNAVAVQPDGKILVGGAFEKINGQRRPFIARLNADGTVDETFAPNGGPSSSWTVFILAIAVQADGKILIGGLFEQVDGVDRTNLARLNSNGTLDGSFNLKGVSGPVLTVKVQTDGRIVIAGVFDQVAGVDSRKIARLQRDGSFDETFQSPAPNAEVRHVLSLPDNRLLISGAFTRVGEGDRRFVALLEENGSVDQGLDLGTGPNERPGSPSVHADGSLYLPGLLSKVNGLPAAHLARLKFGPTPSAITDIGSTPRGEFILRIAGFPGGVYDIDESADFVTWSRSATVRADGFARELTAILPRSGDSRFIRLSNQTPAPLLE